MSYNLKSIKEEFKSKGIFYTPPELALYIKSFIPEHITEVYDPTCGDGGLLRVFGDDVKKYGQDINETQVEYARQTLINFNGVVGDTLLKPEFKDKKFKAIVGNPPFSIKWEPIEDERFSVAPTIPTAGKADYAFILHILHYLAEDGVASVLNFPGVLYRGNREGLIRKWLVKKNYIDKVIHIGGDKFTDTKISTCLIVFRKNKTDKNILFRDDENDIERVVEFDEVKEKDFNLSVSQYIQKEVIKEIIDPVKTEHIARQGFLTKLKQELDFSKMVCNFENINFYDFIDEIQALLNKYKRN